jgi:hypothetical protein
MEVKGIGPAMIETLRPHLAFPTTQSAQATQLTTSAAKISGESQNRPSPGP